MNSGLQVLMVPACTDMGLGTLLCVALLKQELDQMDPESPSSTLLWLSDFVLSMKVLTEWHSAAGTKCLAQL